MWPQLRGTVPGRRPGGGVRAGVQRRCVRVGHDYQHEWDWAIDRCPAASNRAGTVGGLGAAWRVGKIFGGVTTALYDRSFE
jgi:hypothetical protein